MSDQDTTDSHDSADGVVGRTRGKNERKRYNGTQSKSAKHGTDGPPTETRTARKEKAGSGADRPDGDRRGGESGRSGGDPGRSSGGDSEHVDAVSDPSPYRVPDVDPDARDAAGDVFDPLSHLARNGEPVYNKDGTYRKRPGKRQGAGKATNKADSTPMTADTARGLATMAVDMGTGAAVRFGGDLWRASGEEREAMIAAYATWAQTLGDVPPWVQAAVVTAMYALPRVLAMDMARRQSARSKPEDTADKPTSQPQRAPGQPFGFGE